MINKNYVVAVLLFIICFGSFSAQTKQGGQTEKIAAVLDELNATAANANFTGYFNLFAPESTFIGTDATEVWDKSEFMTWAKPYFDKKSTWKFLSLQRNIYTSKDGSLAWFDELLDTQMGLCRGSGILEKLDGSWKIRQYVVSVTVPNEIVNALVKEKAQIENKLMLKLKK